MDVFAPEIYWPILGALIAGAAIGLEREFRARAAGFRTHMLVCVSSALLMVSAVHQVEWMGAYATEDIIRIDPVRMAHGILTGIGFLCGGVIFREGLSVHGLTTAATLWMVSALGVLFGVGLFGLAIGGTVLTLVVLTVFRVVDLYIPSQSMAEVRVRFRREGAPTESDFTALLGKLKIRNRRVAHHLTEGGAFVEFATTIRSVGTLSVSELATHLNEDARVVEYAIQPREG